MKRKKINIFLIVVLIGLLFGVIVSWNSYMFEQKVGEKRVHQIRN